LQAPGIEPGQRPSPDTIEHQSGTIGVHEDPATVSDRASKCAIVRADVTESSEAYELSNVVETALAKALVFAARRWDVVMRIAEELQFRRRAVGEVDEAQEHIGHPPANVGKRR
jgi:hypothetical protein